MLRRTWGINTTLAAVDLTVCAVLEQAGHWLAATIQRHHLFVEDRFVRQAGERGHNTRITLGEIVIVRADLDPPTGLDRRFRATF